MKPAPQTATDKALAERERLTRNYRRAKKAQYTKLFDDQEYGDRLRIFSTFLRHFGIDDASLMIDYVSVAASGWLRSAPDEIRHAALEMIGDRIVRIRLNAGLCEFSDPLPDEPDNTFRICKRALNL